MAKQRKHQFLTSAKAKLIELVLVIAIVIILTVFGLLNRDAFCRGTQYAPSEEQRTAAEPAKVPTDPALYDEILTAFSEASFALQDDQTVLCPDGSVWSCEIEQDASNMRSMELLVPLFADLKETSELAKAFNRQNEAIRQMLLDLFEKVYPALGGKFSDAETFVRGCEAAAKSQKSKTFRTKAYAIQVFPSDDGLRILIRSSGG